MLCLSCVLSNILLALLLGLVAWFIQRWLRWHGIAHVIWVLVLVKLVTPPLVRVPLYESPGNVACKAGTCSCGPHVQTRSWGTIGWVLLAPWLVGAAAKGWTACARWARFRDLMALAEPSPLQWQALADRLGVELAIRNPPVVLAVPGRLPPLVVAGWRQPYLLLPTALMDQLSDSQQIVLILHELVHIKRRDHLVRMLELAVSVIYWWLPIVSLIGRQMRRCEESCCDSAVIARQPHARRDYARLLLDVLDFVAPPPSALEQATAMNSADDLERRLRCVLDPVPKSPVGFWPVAVFAITLACVIVPCELHSDLAGWMMPAARLTNSNLEPEPDPAALANDDGDAISSKSLCCPQ